MNLWAKRVGQLTVLAVALFFFSCEDETSLLGFKNPKKKFDVNYVEIPLSSGVFMVDSVFTDLRPIQVGVNLEITDGILVGEYHDPYFGKVTARSFLPIFASSSAISPPSGQTAVYDSATIQFRLNFYSYGFTGTQQKRFTIHELTGDTLTLFDGNRYYNDSPAPQYDAEPLGEAVITVKYDSLEKQAGLTSKQDTILARIRLPDDYGIRLFDAARTDLTSKAAQLQFKYDFKGFALVPAESNGLLGFNIINNFGQLSSVVLHYHTIDNASGAVKDTLARNFGFNYPGFMRIDTERSGSELASVTVPYQSRDDFASGLRYIQSGAGIVTKVDLSAFYTFADTIENMIVNSAEIIIADVESPGGLKPHSSLMLRALKNEADQFMNIKVKTDRDLLTPYYLLAMTPRNDYYAVSSELSVSSPATLNYDAGKKQFSSYITLFVQSLFTNKNDSDGINENRLKALALYPAAPSGERSVTRTLFHKDDLKLRIYYTIPTEITP